MSDVENKAFQDYLALYEFFSEKPLDNINFDSISNSFQKKFNKNDFLSLGTLLLYLIRQGDLQLIGQKLVGYYILLDLFKNGQAESPFQPALVEAFEAKEMTPSVLVEKFFLAQLLMNGTKDLLKQKTPNHILQTDIQYMKNVIRDMAQNKLKTIKKPNDLPATVQASMINIVPATTRLFDASEKPFKDLMEGMARKDESPLKNVFLPEFLTIAPPLLPCEDELVWFDLTNPAWHKPVFDTSMTPKNDPGSEAKRLMNLASKQVLTLGDQQKMFGLLDSDPELLQQNGMFKPEKLPDLVESNPLLAIRILLKLMNSDLITECLCVLVNMKLSLHSLEVVNRLTNSVELPSEFVHLYISNCIATCEKIEEKYMQSRLVRLVCVFLQSLIRNKIINVKELFLELESFCMGFNWIREAAALYQLLRHMETGDSATVASTSSN